MKKKNSVIRVFVLVSYLAMVFVNFLANFLPINEITTGEVSEMYPNLFAPAGVTFSIWGLIYILLGIYAIYQIGTFQKKKDELLDEIGFYFIVSSIANILWVFSWHYEFIAISLFFIVVILVCLLRVADILRRQRFSGKDYFFIVIPWSIYFGWITVATIANVIVFLVSVGWWGVGITEEIWTILALLTGATIGILRIYKDKSVAYGLVFIWAYSGILIKHLSLSGFKGQYQSVIAITIFCIFLFLVSLLFLIYKKKAYSHRRDSNPVPRNQIKDSK